MIQALEKREDEKLSVEKLHVLLKYLRENQAQKVDGIFRISGRAETVRSVLASLQKDINQPLPLPEDKEECAYVVSTALKGYLTSSEISVVPVHQFDAFIAVPEGPEKLRVATMKKLIDGLPAEHIKIIQCLAEFLQEVISEEASNRMNITNCGISTYQRPQCPF